MTSRPSRREFLRTGSLAVGSVAVFGACTSAETPQAPGTATPPTTSPGPVAPTTPVDSWAPKPVTVGGLDVTCTQQGEQLVLHTRDGERTFLAGVGLTAALPGHAPEEFAAEPEDYRRWFEQMRQVGIRVVRLDGLQAPALYDALADHNETHPDAPLYVLQCVSVPQLANPHRPDRPLTADVRTAMQAEIKDTSDAVHGDLTRTGTDAAPRGAWTRDVSPWIAGWVVGGPWTPSVVLATDRDRDPVPYRGTYVASTEKSTPTESWIAARMDELATLEAARGVSAPIAAANSPETDPLTHPEEPVEGDDLVGIDVTTIRVLPAWPAGTFAAYAAYPFSPAFLRYQNSYQGGDPYRSYLLDLRGHHEGMPLVVTEFGVPASIGRSDNGAEGRNNGYLDERQAMRIDADMLVMFREIGIAGGLLTSWTDDWSAVSPPTAPRWEPVAPERRPLIHDPLTSAEWFGLLAHDPVRAGVRTVHDAPQDEMTKVTVDHDASFFYMTMYFTRRVTSPVDVGFRLYDEVGLRLPGGGGDPIYDVALHFVPTMSTVTMYTRRTLDPTRLDGLPTLYLPRTNSRGWVVQQLTMALPWQKPGERTVPPEMFRVGELALGSWDPAQPPYSSLATWQLVRPDPERPMEWRLRLPWSMLTLMDPGQGKGLVPELGEPTLVDVSAMDVMVESSTPGSPANFTVDLPRWDGVPETTERLRTGIDVLSAAFAEVTGTPDEI